MGKDGPKVTLVKVFDGTRLMIDIRRRCLINFRYRYSRPIPYLFLLLDQVEEIREKVFAKRFVFRIVGLD